MHEFHHIIEFSFIEKKQTYIFRFLDGTCLRVPVEHLPTKLRIKSAHWDEAKLGKNQDSIVVPAGRKRMEIRPHVLYSSGKIL